MVLLALYQLPQQNEKEELPTKHMRIYVNSSLQNNLKVLPMIIESTGRMHPLLIQFIDSVLMEKSQDDPVLKGKLRRYWYSHISCSVHRALAESLILRSTRVNGAITSSMAGDWTLSDAFIDRFQHKNIN
jgi:(2Fe-2S) ferredoxin